MANEAQGLIPTYAGNTLSATAGLRWARAHPHVCGEHYGDSWRKRGEMGSSPRMRGTLFAPDGFVPCFGLIPTYAGNTTAPHSYTDSGRAHPHVCGEHLVHLCVHFLPAGLIPTYAGNTGRFFTVLEHWRAHPHVCGEHADYLLRTASARGSSPRMRGTRETDSKPNQEGGLIPTYAGNTPQEIQAAAGNGAHPHVCGEHSRRAS